MRKRFTSAMKSVWSPPSCLAQGAHSKTAATPGSSGASALSVRKSHSFPLVGQGSREPIGNILLVFGQHIDGVALGLSHKGRLAARRSMLKRTRGGSRDKRVERTHGHAEPLAVHHCRSRRRRRWETGPTPVGTPVDQHQLPARQSFPSPLRQIRVTTAFSSFARGSWATIVPPDACTTLSLPAFPRIGRAVCPTSRSRQSQGNECVG